MVKRKEEIPLTAADKQLSEVVDVLVAERVKDILVRMRIEGTALRNEALYVATRPGVAELGLSIRLERELDMAHSAMNAAKKKAVERRELSDPWSDFPMTDHERAAVDDALASILEAARSSVGRQLAAESAA
ncbi:hypothetical protein [Streptomyces noursei]